MSSILFSQPVPKQLISFTVETFVNIYVVYSRPNGWTDWAEIFLWTVMGYRQKNQIEFDVVSLFHCSVDPIVAKKGNIKFLFINKKVLLKWLALKRKYCENI